MLLKIKEKIEPSENPGQWNESTLKVYLKTDKILVTKVLNAINKAIYEHGAD